MNRGASESTDVEIHLLLAAIYDRYQYDFRGYALASLKRRIGLGIDRLGFRTLEDLQARVIEDPRQFSAFLRYLTVPVSDMFRDPVYWKALREQVVPVLRTYPSIKVWVAGCSTGEEAYSLAILLSEEGLLARSLIYATDIHPGSLEKAEAGVYEVDRFRAFTDRHRLAGGKTSLSDHYQAASGSGILDRELRRRILFSDHSLATDSAFAEVQMVSCRNVMIYFDRELQDRAIAMFSESLCPLGFLGLGSKETLRFSVHAGGFTEWCRHERIYRKKA